MNDNNECYCTLCGEELTEGNTVGVSTTCLACQSATFAKLEAVNGCHLAIFMTCAAYNIPCEPLVCPIDLVNYDGDKWKRYTELLTENDKLEHNGVMRTFFDGVADIRMIFGRDLTESNFAKYIATEKDRLEKMPGSPEQRERWGVNDNYTDDDYNDLDRMYSNRAANYRGMTITPHIDYTLSEVCKWQLLSDKLRRKGDIKGATDCLKTVDQLLASESLRKKDEKPVEALRVDALITAFESAGLMKNGDFLTYDETVEALRDRHCKSRKYDYSLDVADQIIFDIYNNMRANADLPLETELPEEMLAVDEYGEFLPEETEREIENKRYAGVTRIIPEKQGGGGVMPTGDMPERADIGARSKADG